MECDGYRKYLHRFGLNECPGYIEYLDKPKRLEYLISVYICGTCEKGVKCNFVDYE